MGGYDGGEDLTLVVLYPLSTRGATDHPAGKRPGGPTPAAIVSSGTTNGATLPRLRLSLTIPGTVALGAYEGGALAALVVAAKELGEDVLVIDSIATASAGSMTGLLAARSLLDGSDPVGLLTSAAGGNLLSRAPGAPPASTPKRADLALLGARLH